MGVEPNVRQQLDHRAAGCDWEPPHHIWQVEGRLGGSVNHRPPFGLGPGRRSGRTPALPYPPPRSCPS